jgi:urease accessory protein
LRSSCDLRITATAGPAGTVISELFGTEPWRGRILATPASSDWVRVALVQTRASLISADEIAIEVTVGPNAALELVEIGALLATHARGGRRARLTAKVEVQSGGRLIWLGQPWIIAAGAVAESHVSLALAAGARVLRGESVVLGRCGQSPGALSSRSRITLEGRPLLDETLNTADLGVLRSPVVAGPAAMIAAITLAGERDVTAAAGAMQADGPATLWRAAGPAVETGVRASEFAERWRGRLEPAVPASCPCVLA